MIASTTEDLVSTQCLTWLRLRTRRCTVSPARGPGRRRGLGQERTVSVSELGTPMLEVRGLVKDYPGVRALGGVDVTVNSGQVHCLIGQNGAGKSTLIKCVSGLVEPTAGEVRFEGEPLPVGDPNASIAHGIATIYQELDLVPHLSVAQNVFLGHEQKRGPLLNQAAMHRETAALLARLGDEGIAPTAAVTTLRPAQQQVVSMARALSHSAKLLILDEPSAVLDDVEVEALFGVVRRLTAEGVGVIWISHRLGEVAEIGDVVTVLKEGRTVATELPPDTPIDTLIRHMVGGRMETLFPDRKPPREAIVLQVRGLTRPPTSTTPPSICARARSSAWPGWSARA